jgi:hypothetical protein
MNNDCENFKDWIADYVNGILPVEQKKKLADHISHCQDCAEYETGLRDDELLMAGLFQGLEKDLDRQQMEVIKAVQCLGFSAWQNTLSIINGLVNKPICKLAGAAAVFAIVTVYGIRLMGWLYELEKFMDMCTITVK